MVTRFIPKRYEHILDRYTQERIIFMGLLSILCLGLILYGFVGVYLEQHIKARIQEKTVLNNQVAQAEKMWQETEKNIAHTSQLPEAAAFLKDCFTEDGLDLEELVLTPLLAQDQATFKQVVMTIRIKGERSKVFQAVEAVQNTDQFRFIVQELDINGQTTMIQFKLLMHQTN